jgi:hypothetical protein
MVGRLATWEKYVLAGTIVAAGLVSLLVIKGESITPDEVVYIPTGVSYLQQHDLRMNPEHPPLEKILAALPVIIDGARASYEDAAWSSPDQVDFAWASLRAWGPAGAHRVYLARLPMILITLALAVSVFWMARSLGGVAGGILSLAAFVGSPFYFAYGPLVLNDIGVALFALLTVWAFATLWLAPDLKKAIVFGFALSGALLSKFSSGLLLPTLVVLGAWYAFSPVRGSSDAKRATLLSLLGTGVASVVVYVSYAVLFWRTDVVWLLSYQFEHSARPRHAMSVLANMLQDHSWVERISYPALLYAWGVVSNLHGLARPTYLLGRVYTKGTPLFFPALFVYKMTPGFLCLVVLLLCIWIWKLMHREPVAKHDGSSATFHIRAVSMLFFVFALAAVFSTLNIGIRHISVPIASLTVLLGLIVPWSYALESVHARKAVWGLAVLAVVASLGSTAAAFPHYVSYFNSFKGKRPSYELFVGADLDWGQSLIELHDFMQTRQVESIKIDVKGSVPELYLPGVQEFECEDGMPADAEWVAVGASRFITARDLKIDPSKSVPHCGYLFNYPHWINASGTLYVFQVKPAPAGIGKSSAAPTRSSKGPFARRQEPSGGLPVRRCSACGAGHRNS